MKVGSIRAVLSPQATLIVSQVQTDVTWDTDRVWRLPIQAHRSQFVVAARAALAESRRLATEFTVDNLSLESDRSSIKGWQDSFAEGEGLSVADVEALPMVDALFSRKGGTYIGLFRPDPKGRPRHQIPEFRKWDDEDSELLTTACMTRSLSSIPN